MKPIEFTFPLRTVTGMNVREHWARRAKRVRAEHGATTLALFKHAGVGVRRSGASFTTRSLTITLTRLSPKARWMPRKRCWQACDDDAVPPALKGVRDAIASWLGLDDGSDRLTFRYAQERGVALGVRVRIETTERRPACLSPT